MLFLRPAPGGGAPGVERLPGLRGVGEGPAEADAYAARDREGGKAGGEGGGLGAGSEEGVTASEIWFKIAVTLILAGLLMLCVQFIYYWEPRR